MESFINVLSNNKNVHKKMPDIRHYFASGNTGKGFDNLFGHINDPRLPGFMYILKGGPGTGKSTLMKSVGKTFADMGEDIEFFYCSSDYGSLDGIRLSNHNISIVDGTAPHVTDAQMPGIRDKVINLGEFISNEVKQYENAIASLLAKKKIFFDTAYKYIESAANLSTINNLAYAETKTKVNIKAAAKKIISLLEENKINRPFSKNDPTSAVNKGSDSIELNSSNPSLNQSSRHFGKRGTKNGMIRKLYLTAIGDDGIVNIADKNNYNKIITLSYNNLVNCSILEIISDSLTNNGHDITCFCDLLKPQTLHAIYIPQANSLIAKTTAGAPSCANKDIDKHLKFNHKASAEFLKQAALALASAKKQHKKIESFYIPNMDFCSIGNLTANLIAEIKQSIL